jgi:hypothetical protein
MNIFSQFANQVFNSGQRKSTSNTTVLLSKFHKNWSYIQQTLNAKSTTALYHTDIPACLRSLVDTLVEEEAHTELGSTGLCMEYLLKHNILQILCNMSENDTPSGILNDTIKFFSSLIDNLNDKFMVHLNVHRPTLQLLNLCISDEQICQKYDDELVELGFAICTRIASFPELLTIFFNDADRNSKSFSFENLKFSKERLNEPPPVQATLSPSPAPLMKLPDESDFLLFNFLVKFIHNEGKSGDYARTGLLLIMELKNSSIFKYIVNYSDLSEQLAISLQALFAQLPKTIEEKHDITLSLTGNFYIRKESSIDKGKSQSATNLKREKSNTNLKSEKSATNLAALGSTPSIASNVNNAVPLPHELVLFLSILDFCQNAIIKSESSMISQSICEALKTKFLLKILVPSFLHSSENDGTLILISFYTFHMLKILHEDNLSHLFITSLLGEISLDRDGDADNETEKPRDLLYKSLQMFLISKLESKDKNVVLITSRLLSSMINLHYAHSLPQFIPQFYTRADDDEYWGEHRKNIFEPFLPFTITYASHTQLLGTLMKFIPNFRNYPSHLMEAESTVYYHLQRLYETQFHDKLISIMEANYGDKGWNNPKNLKHSLSTSGLHARCFYNYQELFPNSQETDEEAKMVILSKCFSLIDSTIIYKLMTHFQIPDYFDCEYDINLANIDLFLEFLGCPEPFIYHILIHANEYIKACNTELSKRNQSTINNTVDLLVILKHLFNHEIPLLYQEHPDLSQYVSQYRNALQEIYSENGASRQLVLHQAEYNLETILTNVEDYKKYSNYVKNVILLEEFVQNVMAYVQVHSSCYYELLI